MALEEDNLPQRPHRKRRLRKKITFRSARTANAG